MAKKGKDFGRRTVIVGAIIATSGAGLAAAGYCSEEPLTAREDIYVGAGIVALIVGFLIVAVGRVLGSN